MEREDYSREEYDDDIEFIRDCLEAEDQTSGWNAIEDISACVRTLEYYAAESRPRVSAYPHSGKIAKRAEDEFDTELGSTRKVGNLMTQLGRLCLEDSTTAEAWAFRSDTNGRSNYKPEVVLEYIEESVEHYSRPSGLA